MKVIMMMYDSLNRKMLEPYGCDWTKTPNFTRLAEHTVQFTRNYAGSLPCMPARRELHTGRYNFLHRSWGPVEPYDDSMPEILKFNGVFSHLVSDHTHYWEDGGSTYHTRYSSWQNERGQEGDPWKVTPELIRGEGRVQNQDAEYFPITHKMHLQDTANRKFSCTEEKTPLARTFADGLEFVDLNHGEDNWFLQIECFDPHEPFTSPEEYQKLYPDDYDGPVCDWPPYHHVTEDDVKANHLKKQYASLLTMCDTYLGKLLDRMDKYDLWKDTMLIVNTDHGYMLGEHGWWSKGCMPWYEELVHTPLFIHDPRFPECDGQKRNQLVQTIDLPATILEFFNLPLPKDMQGRPIRPILEKNEPIRDYVMFGVHGGHINVSDGRYVYMKAPVTQANSPLYDYTLMPTHMRNRFGVGELQNATLSKDFSFSKGCPLLKIPKVNGIADDDFGDLLMGKGDPQKSRYIDNNSLTNAANFGDKLYDLQDDPEEQQVLDDRDVEVRMANLLSRAMHENEAPKEQYERVGIPENREITLADVDAIHRRAAQEQAPSILADYQWTHSAVNAYQALMRFVKVPQRAKAAEILSDALKETAKDNTVTYDLVLSMIPKVIAKEYCAMIYYFVSLAGRDC